MYSEGFSIFAIVAVVAGHCVVRGRGTSAGMHWGKCRFPARREGAMPIERDNTVAVRPVRVGIDVNVCHSNAIHCVFGVSKTSLWLLRTLVAVI